MSYGSVQHPQQQSKQDQLSIRDDEGRQMDDEEEFNSLLYHLEKKYLCDQHVESFIDLFGTSPCKVANEKGLELLVLDRKNISNLGDEEKLAAFVQNVTEADLEWNNIEKWEVIATLLASLPALKSLSLSHNPIEPMTPIIPPLPVSNKLNTVVLNGVNLPLATVKCFVSALPALKELHLSENTQFDDLHEISTPISTSVSVLHLNACGLAKWSSVLRLVSLFPNIVHLFLADNLIEHVEGECKASGLKTEAVTKSIQSLSLSNCRLKTWTSIENLEMVGKLEELRIRNIPLLEDYTEEERYHLVVGRVRSLNILNGSIISAFQREESERFFIRYYQGSEEKPKIFEELVKLHGNLEQLVKVDLTPQRFAKVVIKCEETNYRSSARIKLNGTVLGLMKYATKVTGIPYTRMRIFYFDVNVTGCGPMELRFPNQLLQSLHIEDEDEFFIQSKIVSPKRSQP